MAKPKMIQSPAMRRFDDDTVDLRSYINRGGFGDEFTDTVDQNNVTFSSNAHDERQYEDMRRLPDQTTYVDKFDENRNYIGMERVITDPPMSLRTKNQVFTSIGSNAGTMTSASQLDHSKGCGEYGADGGLRDRAQVRPSDLYLGNPSTSGKGRY